MPTRTIIACQPAKSSPNSPTKNANSSKRIICPIPRRQQNSNLNLDSPQRPPVGVPGKTYPYPLEEDEETQNNFDDFRKVRDILMDHAHQLATNLKPDDPDINRRSLALSRILDRVHQLDEMLPDLNPESVLRFEYVYDGQVHNIAPWEASEEYLEKQLKWVREQKAREARGGFDNGSSTT